MYFLTPIQTYILGRLNMYWLAALRKVSIFKGKGKCHKYDELFY